MARRSIHQISSSTRSNTHIPGSRAGRGFKRQSRRARHPAVDAASQRGIEQAFDRNLARDVLIGEQLVHFRSGEQRGAIIIGQPRRVARRCRKPLKTPATAMPMMSGRHQNFKQRKSPFAISLRPIRTRHAGHRIDATMRCGRRGRDFDRDSGYRAAGIEQETARLDSDQLRPQAARTRCEPDRRGRGAELKLGRQHARRSNYPAAKSGFRPPAGGDRHDRAKY